MTDKRIDVLKRDSMTDFMLRNNQRTGPRQRGADAQRIAGGEYISAVAR